MLPSFGTEPVWFSLQHLLSLFTSLEIYCCHAVVHHDLTDQSVVFAGRPLSDKVVACLVMLNSKGLLVNSNLVVRAKVLDGVASIEFDLFCYLFGTI